ncbi:hypothetical protein ACI3ER_12050 [Bacillus sp. Wb]
MNEEWLSYATANESTIRLHRYAKKLGYDIHYSKYKSNSSMNPKSKIILIGLKTDNNLIYTLAHEIGHHYAFPNSKKLMVLKEHLAWIAALFICIRNRIPVGLEFYKLARKCLSTYYK